MSNFEIMCSGFKPLSCDHALAFSLPELITVETRQCRCTAAVCFRSCNCSPALEYEVDAHSVDNQACTPLVRELSGCSWSSVCS